MNARLQGIVLVITAAILWGTTGTAQSFAPLTLSSYWVGAARLLVAGCFFVFWLLLVERRSLGGSQIRALPWTFIVLAALSMVVYNLAFFAGVRATSVAIGTALTIGSGPLWAGVLQLSFTRQLPAKSWWIAVSTAIAGLLIAALSARATVSLTMPGISLCLLSGLAYAVYALVTKRLVSSASATVTTAAVFALAAMLATPVAFALAGLPSIHLSDLPVMLWLGIVATSIAYFLFSLGLRSVSGPTGVALALAEPIAAVCFAVAIVGERPGMISVSGMLLMLIGLGLLIRLEVSKKL